MKLGFTIVTVALLFASCTNPKMKEINALKTECIAIHDEVMPKMGRIVELSSELKNRRSALDADTSALAGTMRRNYVAHVQLLDSAHEAMMQWMHDYKVDYEVDAEPDSAIAYYNSEIVKLTEVKKLMLKSIGDGEAILEAGN